MVHIKNISSVMVKSLNFEQVAVALIFADDATAILIARRHQHLHQGGKWEFPGGKLENGEATFDALKRECLEEVNLNIISAEPFCKIPFNYDDKTVLLDTWRVTQYAGEARGLEQQELCWVKLSNLKSYHFPKPNQKIIDQLLKAVCPS